MRLLRGFGERRRITRRGYGCGRTGFRLRFTIVRCSRSLRCASPYVSSPRRPDRGEVCGVNMTISEFYQTSVPPNVQGSRPRETSHTTRLSDLPHPGRDVTQEQCHPQKVPPFQTPIAAIKRCNLASYAYDLRYLAKVSSSELRTYIKRLILLPPIGRFNQPSHFATSLRPTP